MYKHYPDNYVYPMIIERTDKNYGGYFPDLPGCVALGKDFPELLKQAKEGLALHLWGLEQDELEAPAASFPEDIKLKEGESLCYLDVNMLSVRIQMDNRSIKKTLTIPWYLNELGEQRHVNFSRLLQKALKEEFGIA